jgi:hypothetical protein
MIAPGNGVRVLVEAHEIAERVGEGEDLGGQATLGAADDLALSPLLRLARDGGP